MITSDCRPKAVERVVDRGKTPAVLLKLVSLKSGCIQLCLSAGVIADKLVGCGA